MKVFFATPLNEQQQFQQQGQRQQVLQCFVFALARV